MRSLNWFAVAVAFLVALPSVMSQTDSAPKKMESSGLARRLSPGAVVEKVAKHSEGEKAGLKEGDLILSWSRDDAQGTIDSPFDLAQLEMEQGPRGGVRMAGRRGAAALTWTIGVGEWGLSSRPDFPPRPAAGL